MGPLYCGANGGMGIAATTGHSGSSECLGFPGPMSEGGRKFENLLKYRWGLKCRVEKATLALLFHGGHSRNKRYVTKKKSMSSLFLNVLHDTEPSEMKILKRGGNWEAVQMDRDMTLWKYTKGTSVGLFCLSPLSLFMQPSLDLSEGQAVVT